MEMKELLKKYGMIITDVESKNGFILVYIETDKSLKLNEYQTLKYKIENKFRMVPVFTFQSLNGMQRKRFIEENISFCLFWSIFNFKCSFIHLIEFQYFIHQLEY